MLDKDRLKDGMTPHCFGHYGKDMMRCPKCDIRKKCQNTRAF